MSLSNGVALIALFEFYSAGVLTDPAILPTTVSGSLYPNGTAGPTPALTHVGTGLFSATIFSTAQNVQTGTYKAWLYVDDDDLDSGYSRVQWLEVGIGIGSAGVNITTVGPMVTGRPIRIYRGFDYRTPEAQQIYWDLVGWPTLVGATAKFLGCGSELSLAVNTVTNRLTLELTKAQSTALALGFDTYGIYVTFANTHETLVGVGDIQVRPRPD